MKSRPIKENGYSNRTLHAKRDRKRDEAEARNHRWQNLTYAEQLDSLKIRRGNSERQRNRICDRLAVV